MKNNQSDYMYIVSERAMDGEGDSMEFFFDDLADANSRAQDLWYHLSKREKTQTVVEVLKVTLEDLDEDAFDEETGEIDWGLYHSADIPEGGFCSLVDGKEKEEEEEEEEDD